MSEKPEVYKMFYRCVDHCEESFFELETTIPFHGETDDLEMIAEDAANDYYISHDGWESDWPLTFAIHETNDGPELGRFDVELDMSPKFHAKEQA